MKLGLSLSPISMSGIQGSASVTIPEIRRKRKTPPSHLSSRPCKRMRISTKNHKKTSTVAGGVFGFKTQPYRLPIYAIKA